MNRPSPPSFPATPRCGTRRLAGNGAAISVFSFILLFSAVLFGQQSENPLGLQLSRSHASSYLPGEPVEIILVIEGWTGDGIRALGVEEMPPEGWRMIDIRGHAGDMPQIQPEPGATGPLEFAWISPPPIPCAFSYTLMVPEDDGGTKELFGSLEYRLEGGPHRAPPAITTLSGPEQQAPTLVLRGAASLEIRTGTAWRDPGYTALDANNEDISGAVVVSGMVNTDTPGSYLLEYRVTSPRSGLSATATRWVRVVSSDTTPGESQSSGGAAAPTPAETVEPADADITELPGLPSDGGTTEEPLLPPTVDLPDLSRYRPVPFTPDDDASTAAGAGMDGTHPSDASQTLRGEAAFTREVVSTGQQEGSVGGRAAAQKGADQEPRQDRGTLAAGWVRWTVRAGILVVLILIGGWAFKTAYGPSVHERARKKR